MLSGPSAVPSWRSAYTAPQQPQHGLTALSCIRASPLRSRLGVSCSAGEASNPGAEVASRAKVPYTSTPIPGGAKAPADVKAIRTIIAHVNHGQQARAFSVVVRLVASKTENLVPLFAQRGGLSSIGVAAGCMLMVLFGAEHLSAIAGATSFSELELQRVLWWLTAYSLVNLVHGMPDSFDH